MAKRACIWKPGRLAPWANLFFPERSETDALPPQPLPKAPEQPVFMRATGDSSILVNRADEAARLARLKRKRNREAKEERLTRSSRMRAIREAEARRADEDENAA